MLYGDNIIPILGVMSITIYFSFWLERKHIIFKSLGSAFITFLIAGILCGTGILPSQHIFYAQIFTWGIPLALASSLITSEPIKNKRLGSVFIKSLVLGIVVLILIGSITTLILYVTGVPDYPNANSAYILDIFYTLITPKALSQFPREGYSLFAVLGNGLFPFILVTGIILPVLLRRIYPTMWMNIPMDETKVHAMEGEGRISFDRPNVSLENLSILLALVLLCISIAEGICIRYYRIPFLVLLGFIGLIVRKAFQLRGFESTSNLVAEFMTHLLFFSAGTLLGDVQFLKLAGPITILSAALIGLEFFLILLVGRILRLDIETLTVIALSLTGGPYAAYAVAVIKKWQPLYWVALVSGIIIYELIGLMRNILFVL